MFRLSISSKRSLFFIGLLLALAICFETLQHLYYIERYNIAEGITFIELFKKQASRWILWLFFGSSIIWYTKKHMEDFSFRPNQLLKFTAFIFLLVFLNIFFISILQLILNGEAFSVSLLLSEYFPFYLYQKAPIFTLGYMAVSVVLYFYFSNEKLQVRVEKLDELKETHKNLYEELKSQLEDRSSILSIKIGNKRRIIPISEIIWIEADDYCAKIHVTSGRSYSMRSSLKRLEETLKEPFMRVHRKAIVNMSMIKELNTHQSPSLVLNNDQEIAVSKRNLRSIKNYIS